MACIKLLDSFDTAVCWKSGDSVAKMAKANLFSVPGGYVVPVTFGNAVKQARVELRQLDKAPGRQSFKAEVIHPGGTDWRPLAVVENDGVVVLDVPLSRGCAMVRIQ